MNSCAPMARAAASMSARGAPGPTEADVVGDGPGEQEALLRDGDDGAAEVDLGEVTQVDPVEQQASFDGVPEPGCQAGDGGLAGAGGADDREGLAGGDREIEPVQHGAIAVAELDGLEAQLAAGVGEGGGRRPAPGRSGALPAPRRASRGRRRRPGTGCRTGSAPPSGAKKRRRYSRKAASTPTVILPSSTRSAPTSSTAAVVRRPTSCTPGPNTAPRRWDQLFARR